MLNFKLLLKLYHKEKWINYDYLFWNKSLMQIYCAVHEKEDKV